MSSIANFSNLWKKNSRLSCSIFWKGFENKSHQRRYHYLKPSRNGGSIPRGGGAKPTHGLAHRSAWGSAWRSAQDLAQGLVWGSARGVGPGVGLVVSLGPGPGIGLELALGGQVDGSQTGSGGQLWRPAQGLAQRVAQG